jgi:signal transduction histidine kinase
MNEADANPLQAREGAWLSRLSHDLRNQLAPMRTAAQLLRSGKLEGARQEEMLELIDRQIQRIVRMLDDLSEFGHLRSGQGKRRERLDLAFVVDSAVSEFGQRLRAAQLQLDQRMPERRLPIEAERQRLVNAVARLLDNAIRATPAGGTVLLHVDDDGAQATIRVQDTGRGIDPPGLERVFELPDGPRSGEGLGISLHLARACARDHGGSLEAHSQGEGRGCVFVLRLPLLVA